MITKTVVEWIREVFPKLDHTTGTALWTAFINRDVYTPDGKLIRGSFRWWGGVIADIVDMGEDYMNYYCSYADDALVKEVERKLVEVGWKLDYIPRMCSVCKKPIERNSTVAIDFKTGNTSHVDCGLEKNKLGGKNG